MSQQNPHLTTEQLSTLLDEQLPPEDQAACNAHLDDCKQCQYALNDLQQTVHLLRSLPQLEVPRTFTLPADFKITFDENEPQQIEQPTARTQPSPRKSPTPLRRTLRTISALAAVVGLFLALSSFITTLQLNTGMNAAPRTFSQTNPSTGSQPQETPQATKPLANSKTTSQPSLSPTSPSVITTTPNKPQPQPTTTQNSPTQPSSPFLNFNQPTTRLSTGIVLLILGGLGLTFLAQRKKSNTRPVKKISS